MKDGRSILSRKNWTTSTRELLLRSLRRTPTDPHASRFRSFAHFSVEIEDLNIHFIHHRSDSPTAIPLILIHGWVPLRDLLSRFARTNGSPPREAWLLPRIPRRYPAFDTSWRGKTSIPRRCSKPARFRLLKPAQDVTMGDGQHCSGV